MRPNQDLNKNWKFFVYIFLISLLGGVIRYINITYSSLWSDEIYSVLSVHPGNSWYEILYMQRGHQPPLYFLLLWQWTKLFGYTEFSARLLSVAGGVASIFVSGYLGKMIKDVKTGMLMALLVAFNPMQIWYSLEARFYIFAYFFAALSLLIYWHIISKKPKGYFIYLVKSGTDAVLVYFHHFGIFFLFAQFVYDIILLRKDKDKAHFFKKLGGYVLSAILYLPWFFWGFIQGLEFTSYWLKEINVIKYFTFSLDFPPLVNLIASAVILYFLYMAIAEKKIRNMIFPLICISVTIFPYLYSEFRIPILVDRYGIVMGPAIYLMLVLGLTKLAENFGKVKPQLASGLIILSFLFFCYWGVYESFINKEKLVKQPWREMGAWLNKQSDLDSTPVYSLGRYVKNLMNINFYIDSTKKITHINKLDIGKDNKMYLIESNSVWKISDSILNKVESEYNVQEVSIDRGSGKFCNVYVCRKKESQTASSQ